MLTLMTVAVGQLPMYFFRYFSNQASLNFCRLCQKDFVSKKVSPVPTDPLTTFRISDILNFEIYYGSINRDDRFY